MRSLPALPYLSQATSAWLRRVAFAGPEGLRINLLECGGDSNLLRLVQIGVFDLDDRILRFSSSLMQTHALKQLFSSRRTVPVIVAGASATYIAREIIRRMDPVTLGGSLSVSATGTLLERQYQMTFFA